MNTQDILQRCLEDLAAGRKTAAECAEQYPQVPDLLAQLRAAAALKAWPPATVALAATQRHQAQLRAALAANQARNRQPALALWPRWAMAAALVVALVLGGAGTVSAAADSVPGQALYPVKRVAEAVQDTITPPAAQAAWHVGLAEERTRELLAVSAQAVPDPALLEQIAVEIGAETQTALADMPRAAAGEQAALLQKILAQIERQVDVLMALRARLPAQAQAGLDQAITVSRSNREAALAQLSTVKNRPNAATEAVPPGQAKKTATTQAATDLPPGHEKKTATAATAQATRTPPGNSGGQGPAATPKCTSSNPKSPKYCTPTPSLAQGSGSSEATPPPTPCLLNPAGNPVCNNRP